MTVSTSYHQYTSIFTSAVSWNMELIHMKENCNNIL